MTVEQKAVPVQIFSNLGMENMDVDFQNMFDKIMPKSNQNRNVTVKEARKILMEQETEALIDRQTVTEKAVALVENQGIIFIDELDKVCGPSSSMTCSRCASARSLSSASVWAWKRLRYR